MSEILSIVDSVVLSCKQKLKIEEAKVFLNIASNNCIKLSQLDRIAFLQNEIKDYRGCIESLKKCLSLATNDTEKSAVRANMAKVYNHLNEPLMSLSYSKLNHEQYFDYDTLMEMSFSYYLTGNYKQAEKMMRDLFTHDDLPEEIRGRVEYNLGSFDLERGDFKKGLVGFVEVGHKIKIWNERYIPNVPIWKGENISGKNVIIHAEGGIGDEIINFRFCENIKKLGGNPIWNSNYKNLAEVFSRHGVQTFEPKKNENSVQCMAMYLPIILDLDKDQLWTGPYLKPCDNYLEKWEKILPKNKKLAVKWSGNPFYDQDLHRSIPLDHIKKIKYNGTKVNLQLEKELFQTDMFNAGEYINNIEDTLALLWLCDDLITSCTSVAHMNGAMNKNGIVCPPIASYYVWLGDAKWYGDSLKVVRQTKHKDWEFVKTLL